jgi:molybdopterin molybdotransferase
MPEPSPHLLPVEDHLARVLARIEPLAPYEHSLLDALGLPAAEDVHATVPLPVFDNSGMDGYAVVFRDVADATPERPIHLPVQGEIAAGDTGVGELTPGTAIRIMTGAPIPAGASAVVPFEWTDESDGEVRVSRGPEQGQHIRRAGEEVSVGDVLVRRGDVLTPRTIGLLAAMGLNRISTSPRPRVVVMSTGSELVEPGRPLGADRIYDANSYLLAAAVRDHGGVAFRVQASSDDPEAFTEALSDQLLRADMVITSGGVSKGTHDVVKEVLGKLGTVDFVEVAMQPGKPQGFGTVGEDRTPIFTLPGNPVSAYVSFETFVVPALRKLTGHEDTGRTLLVAAAGEQLRSMRGKRQLVRAQVSNGEAGLVATPVGGAGSHLIAGLAQADALIVLEPDVTRVERGEPVPVLLLDGQS